MNFNNKRTGLFNIFYRVNLVCYGWGEILKKSVLVFMLLVCHSAHALTIQHVSHYPKQIDLNKNETVIIKYSLDESAQVKLNIYDDRDFLIRRISSKGELKKGDHSFTWNGYDQANHPVPPEAYRYTLVASNGTDSVEHDLSDLTGGQVVKVHQLKWDKKAKKVQYRVLKSSRVNVRVGLKNNGPLMATITDWVARGHGLHEVSWDGFDNSGVIDVSKNKGYEIYAQAFTLSENTILVGPSDDDIKLIDITWKKEKRTRKKQQKKRMKMHSQQYIENRGDFTLQIKLPESLKKTKLGMPIVNKKVPVRFNVPPDVQQRMLNDRFEPILFVDGNYKTENEVGFFPMTWNWDPKNLAEGEHVLTINLRGYDGHLGSASVKIFVKN